MNMITDYFSPPFAKNKSAKKCNKQGNQKKIEACDSSAESFVGDENDEVYYETRKIKIRLSDPNVPDSYVCEVYDTSIEEEGQQEEGVKNSVDDVQEVKENVNVKENAFDVLMAGAEKKSKEQQIVKKRSRSNKTCNVDDSDSSSDEALILVS